MERFEHGISSAVLAALLACALPLAASAGTRYVADGGSDGGNCGLDAATACRSITRAIALAAPLDIIMVGPGRYGDLNRNGALGDITGEETGSPGCSCVLSINKNVIVISSGGAAVTVIDGRTVDVIQNVLLITNGGEFGRPAKGFTVTETAQRQSGILVGEGIVIDSINVLVRGNQVTFTRLLDSFGGTLAVSGGTGILTVNNEPIRIEGNQVSNWNVGINGRGAATVSKNQVIRNQFGIVAQGGTVVANVATSNRVGIYATGATTVRGNAAYMNFGALPDEFSGGTVGFEVAAPFSGVFTKNNMFANGFPGGNCGLQNDGVSVLNATNNYWGAPTGPGALPANDVCNSGFVSTTTAPYATKPFAVVVLKP